jgi:hypothetical protein
LLDRLIVNGEDYSLNEKGSSVLEHLVLVLEPADPSSMLNELPRFF